MDQHTADDVDFVLALSVNKCAAAAGLSRSTIYEALKTGDLKSIKIGARRLILVDDLRTWLHALRDSPQ